MEEATLSYEQHVRVDDVLVEIRDKTEHMSGLAENEAWEDLLDIVRERHALVERCLEAECAPLEKRALLEMLQSLLQGDSILIERCAREREATRSNLENMGRADKARLGYQLA